MGMPAPLRLCTAPQPRASNLGRVSGVGHVGDSGFVDWAGGPMARR